MDGSWLPEKVFLSWWRRPPLSFQSWGVLQCPGPLSCAFNIYIRTILPDLLFPNTLYFSVSFQPHHQCLAHSLADFERFCKTILALPDATIWDDDAQLLGQKAAIFATVCCCRILIHRNPVLMEGYPWRTLFVHVAKSSDFGIKLLLLVQLAIACGGGF